MQNDIEQGFVNTDTSVVLDEAQLPKPVHEEADVRPGSSDHLRQRLLCNLWDERFLLTRSMRAGRPWARQLQSSEQGMATTKL